MVAACRDCRCGAGGVKPIIMVIPGNPVPLGRPRVTRYGTFTPKRSEEAKDRIANLTKIALMQFPERFPLYEEFNIVAAFYEGVKSETHMADVDNCLKLLMDALIGVVWVDDKLVTRIEATIERGVAEPRTEFIITKRKTRR